MKNTRVCCSTAGPYALYGRELASLCARSGTDYVDITGELQFVRESIQENHAAAVENGCRIVHCCGYDSVPMDLSTLMVMERMAAEDCKASAHDADVVNAHGELTVTVDGVVGPCLGGFSGGTVNSGMNIMDDPDATRIARNPLALNTADADGAGVVVIDDVPDQFFLGRLQHSPMAPKDDDGRRATFPSVMQVVNTRVVRRSAQLLGYTHPAKGATPTHFRFSEATLAPNYLVGVAASVVAVIVGSLLKVGYGSRCFSAHILCPLARPHRGRAPFASVFHML